MLFDGGDEVAVQAGGRGDPFLPRLVQPLREPVAWRGPIVLNAQEEFSHPQLRVGDGAFTAGELAAPMPRPHR